jgi:hypothetical protein
LLTHFDKGRGNLCKDPVFVTDLITLILKMHMQEVATLDKKINLMHAEATAARVQEKFPMLFTALLLKHMDRFIM